MCISFCGIFVYDVIKFEQNGLTVIGGVSDLKSDEIVRLCNGVRTCWKCNVFTYNFGCSPTWVVIFFAEEDD